MRRFRSVLVIPAILLLQCAKDGEVTVPERSLGEAAGRFNQPFTHLSGIRELADGRVIVADPQEKKVILLDSSWTGAEPVGRQGQGPGEYSFPASLLPFPGDSTLIFDLFNNRFLLLDPNGATARTVAVPQVMGFGMAPRGDGLGNVFLRANPLPSPGQMQRGMPESAPILRWNLASGKVDTVASVRLPQVEGGGSADGGFVFMMQPMPAADEWSVTSDGWIGIARVLPYSAEWVKPSGETVRGTAISYDPVPVTEDDKTEWQRQMSEGGGGEAVSIPLGGGGGDPPPVPDEIPPGLPELKWPTHKPPFLERSVIAGPGRRLWIRRTGRAGGQTAFYDVVDSTGSLVERVSLPAGSRIMGFGPASIYVARTDSDGLQWLERYRL